MGSNRGYAAYMAHGYFYLALFLGGFGTLKSICFLCASRNLVCG